MTLLRSWHSRGYPDRIPTILGRVGNPEVGNSGPECCSVSDNRRLVDAVREVEFRLNLPYEVKPGDEEYTEGHSVGQFCPT
jgi:hypothetical protein